MDIDYLRKNGLILLEAISGSRAYGLATLESDTDIKGVFFLPKEVFYGTEYIAQISDEGNNKIYYEIGRYMQLLSVNNPNILELLNTPEDCVVYRNPIFKEIRIEHILSKLCELTFGKFAIAQIKKAKGLNKKIVNPLGKTRKSVLDFCYVNYGHGSLPLQKYLAFRKLKQEDCGLVNIPHMLNVYGLYGEKKSDYKGIIQKEDSNGVSLSSIPANKEQLGLLYFNQLGYSTYCKRYREYYDWVEKRNEVRYENTLNHGKEYDAKNMMHTFRLLDMAIEIAQKGKINVRRPNREFLLSIKNGDFGYDELLELAEQKQFDIQESFKESNLRENPDKDYINKVLFQIRENLYG